jgi:uncharacterized protein involved in exopolysaccharide biosynthesis
MPKPTTRAPEPNAPQQLLTLVPEIWAGRRWIALFVLFSTILAIVYSLMQSNQFTAETTILPELERSKLLGLAGMSDLASAAGVSVGETPIARLYPLMVRSDRILREVIHKKYATPSGPDSVNLIQYWHFDGHPEEEAYELTLKTLRDRMDLTFDSRLLTLVLRVVMEEARLAADVANQVTAQLDIYTRTKRRTSVTAQREFIEKRLGETQGSLTASEDRLRSFREKNRRIIDSPMLLLEQARLEREFQINSTIFVELKKQVEIAKIEEIKNIPIINVLDLARVPISRSAPKRTATVVWIFSFSLVIGILAAGGLVHPVTARWMQDVRSVFVGMSKTPSS